MVILDESDENSKLQTIGVQNNQVEPILLTYQLSGQKIIRTIIVLINGISLPYNVIDMLLQKPKKIPADTCNFFKGYQRTSQRIFIPKRFENYRNRSF